MWCGDIWFNSPYQIRFLCVTNTNKIYWIHVQPQKVAFQWTLIMLMALSLYLGWFLSISDVNTVLSIVSHKPGITQRQFHVTGLSSSAVVSNCLIKHYLSIYDCTRPLQNCWSIIKLRNLPCMPIFSLDSQAYVVERLQQLFFSKQVTWTTDRS